jgi:HAD superfamily hydrolase (TIGR01509 family)
MYLNWACLIFDCDGTLIDSEGLYAHADAAVLNELGLQISESVIRHRFTGIDRRSMLRSLQHNSGLFWPADIESRLDRAVSELAPARLQPMEGALETLKALTASGLRLAVASNSSLGNVSRMLQLCNLQSFFEGRIATADQVVAPKPAPDVYVLAADMLGVPCRDCLAIDDTPSGVQAAHAAGMTVVGFSPIGHVHTPRQLREAGALTVVDSLADLPTSLGSRRS